MVQTTPKIHNIGDNKVKKNVVVSAYYLQIFSSDHIFPGLEKFNYLDAVKISVGVGVQAIASFE